MLQLCYFLLWMYEVQSLWMCRALPVENVQRIHAVSLSTTIIKQELQTLFSSVFLFKALPWEVMGGGREVERLVLVLVLAASLDFTFIPCFSLMQIHK